LALPVDSLLPEIVASLRRCPNLVIEAPPGAGKTTRVPSALLDAGFGEVLVLQPRRIAARLAARRVALERGESLGETVGYQVRFEQFAGPKTRLRFLTEGVLTRRLLSDPELQNIGVVVLDEFHERHLEGDLALALLRRLQQTTRPDLRLVVMSATLSRGERSRDREGAVVDLSASPARFCSTDGYKDATAPSRSRLRFRERLRSEESQFRPEEFSGDPDDIPVAAALGGCPILRSDGRLFPLEVDYTPHSAASLEDLVLEAVEGLLKSQSEGDILVFLPGAFEIRRAQRALAGVASRKNLLLAPLYGDLTPDEQDRAIQPASQRKVILSTNVAESSVTIEGVRAVIDSGLHRVAADSSWTGLPRVEVMRISRASATQRAGRAGRTAPGTVIRLYSQDDFLRRPEHDQPEILRREITQLCLDLHVAGVGNPLELEWLDAPPAEAISTAEELLRRLRAVDDRGRVTPLGRKMAALPLHPRLAALAFAADELGAGAEGCIAAAALSTGERLPETPPHDSPNDLELIVERRPEAKLRQVEQQLRRLVRPRSGGDSAGLRRALLRAFPDRVGRRRKGLELRMVGGVAVQQAKNSSVQRAGLLVLPEIEERPDLGAPIARLVCAIEPEWLLDEFPELVTDSESVEWNRETERVERVSSLLYGDLVIDESRGGQPDSAQAAELLARKATEAGLHRWADADALAELRSRVAFAAPYTPLQPLDDAAIQSALQRACYGLASLRELEHATGNGAFLRQLIESLGAGAARQLDEVAPERIRLPSGRHARVHYVEGQTPWVGSRLQDFFGLRDTPRIAHGQVNLVVHLLAPSQRPVQTTQDLAGFWERLYPQLRKELSRRYPRHSWPEDPYQAEKSSARG
jgi:ATP-dependent helicase HrpB